jgi:hypothetical protein
MPRVKNAPQIASCAECGCSFPTTRGATFCSTPHRVAHERRRMARGKVLAPYVLAWIEGKGGGHSGVDPIAAKAMRELTAIARGYVDEDRKAGRPSALAYMETLLADGARYFDRQRVRRPAG